MRNNAQQSRIIGFIASLKVSMKPLLLAAAMLAAGTGAAHAITCAPADTVNVLKARDGYVFYVSKAYGDAAFMVPGKDFANDQAAPPGSPQFTVDGVHYQFLAVPKANYFAKLSKAPDHAAILERHARSEHRYAVNAGARFTAMQDLGTRLRPADGANPDFSFKMWTLRDPKQPDGPSQHMLSTVIGDDVVVLSATVPSKARESAAMAVFERFSASYQFLKTQKECPPAPPPKPKAP
jgi:hypothetical protein